MESFHVLVDFGHRLSFLGLLRAYNLGFRVISDAQLVRFFNWLENSRTLGLLQSEGEFGHLLLCLLAEVACKGVACHVAEGRDRQVRVFEGVTAHGSGVTFVRGAAHGKAIGSLTLHNFIE